MDFCDWQGIRDDGDCGDCNICGDCYPAGFVCDRCGHPMSDVGAYVDVVQFGSEEFRFDLCYDCAKELFGREPAEPLGEVKNDMAELANAIKAYKGQNGQRDVDAVYNYTFR